MLEGYGLPVDGGASWRKALREYVLNPADATWDELAHKIVPNACGKTMWQAWMLIDSTAPTSLPAGGLHDYPPPEERWMGRRPSVFVLKRMIEFVQDREFSVEEFLKLLNRR